ncbi:MAG: 2,3-bisphosphoglycerate-independent phosphoglycerate mutase [Candidatus Portiera sp.]|nr:2,3-bisphosphoglycerate-independent phosphoglycerate mutase [Portiera sp.]
MKPVKTTALIILDGWGQGKDYPGNAIQLATTPNWDKLVKERPMRQLVASGELVGLPAGQMGNSEVGHTILGAGRIIYQTLLRINRSLEDNSLASNKELNNFLANYKAIQKNMQNAQAAADAESPCLHLMGLLSDGGVHSHQEHLVAILEIAKNQGLDKIMLHLFMDGRDTSPKSAVSYVKYLEEQIERLGAGQIVTVSGRYYAMDRDKRWERTSRVYNLLTSKDTPDAQVPVVADICEHLEFNYDQEVYDEFIPPFITTDGAQAIKERGRLIRENDFVISVNFRADRMRQLTAALAAKEFTEFNRPFVLPQSSLLTMTKYDSALPLPHIFDKEDLDNLLGELIAAQGMKQLRLAETEKFAHVTYFFNGGRDEAFRNEERRLIPSLKVATYDLAPQMCAPEITDELVAAIASEQYDFILCNYANGDMVGHSGNLDAAIQTVEVIDANLQRVLAALDSASAQALITADHGNCEEMLTVDSLKPHTAHTLNPVPLIYYGPHNVEFDKGAGGLADIAPTLVDLMGLEVPQEMSGRGLLKINPI